MVKITCRPLRFPRTIRVVGKDNSGVTRDTGQGVLIGT